MFYTSYLLHFSQKLLICTAECTYLGSRLPPVPKTLNSSQVSWNRISRHTDPLPFCPISVPCRYQPRSVMVCSQLFSFAGGEGYFVGRCRFFCDATSVLSPGFPARRSCLQPEEKCVEFAGKLVIARTSLSISANNAQLSHPADEIMKYLLLWGRKLV